MLARLDDLKAELNISDTSQDSRLSFLLKGASAMVESYCQRSFGITTTTENLDPRGRQKINLQYYPIVSVSSVILFTLPINDYQIDAEAGQLWRLVSWPWSPMLLQGDITLDPDPNHADRILQVTYTGGYVLPDDPACTLPFDIQYSTVRQAAALYLRPIGFKMERTPGGYQYEAFDSQKDGLISEITPLLDPYKRRQVVVG